jgi:hypothetical protein
MNGVLKLAFEEKIFQFNGKFSLFAEDTSRMLTFLLESTKFQEDLLKDENSVRMPEILRLGYSLSGHSSCTIHRSGYEFNISIIEESNLIGLNRKLQTHYTSLLILRKKSTKKEICIIYDPKNGLPIDISSENQKDTLFFK